MQNMIQEYTQYIERTEFIKGDRYKTYKAIVEEFDITSALYPGSHIDITPSLLIPCVTYVDNFKGTIRFFKHLDSIKTYIEENKKYKDKTDIDFLGVDYASQLTIHNVDCIISQYAGFVGQITKGYLKSGGILLCNDSHGDATLAYHDTEYIFIGVLKKQNDSYIVDRDHLSDYFKLPKDKKPDVHKVLKDMKGPKYLLNADNYLFQKI